MDDLRNVAEEVSEPGLANAADSQLPLQSEEYEKAFGEPLSTTLNMDTWEPGENLAALYGRLETEIAEAVKQEKRLRERVREIVFPLLRSRPNAPSDAGVYQAKVSEIEKVHSGLLFNGAVEACDGTSVVHDTLPITIAQIGISLVSYRGDQGTWVQRLYRRDLRLGGKDPVDETLELLERRKKRSGEAGTSRDRLSDLGRRGIMTYAERAVLLRKSNALWRMGHGNPTPYELISGSGMPELLGKSLDLLREFVLDFKRIVFVPSAPSDRVLLTIGNALKPLEYAVVDTMQEPIERIVNQGHYRGQWEPYKNEVTRFAKEVGSRIVTGVFRASAMAPAQVFYGHVDHIHQAALIAIADSTLQEHRGFPMLIDLADNVCSSTCGQETLVASAQLAYSNAGEPFRYLSERQTRK